MRLWAFAVIFAMCAWQGFAQVVVPGGQSIGVALRTGGVVVIGAAVVGSSPSPARLAGLRSGDVIVSIDGVQPFTAGDVTVLLHEGECRVTYQRNGVTQDVLVTPVKSEGAFRLGAWVRDSAAGIGTLTFYDPETGRYGALGHPVTDADTAIVLPVEDGTIYENTIVGIEKGKNGIPGEILGQFYDGSVLGDIDVNSEVGIFGYAAVPPEGSLYPEGLETVPAGSVRTGSASILTTVDEKGMREFDCEILRIDRSREAATRSFTVRITDEELLSITGGIVQGMSGSPIIQDGKLVGAVTHVLVNQPDTGYGIFIDNMLDVAS